MKLIFKAFVSLSMQSAYTDTDAAKILHRATVLVLTSFSLSLSPTCYYPKLSQLLKLPMYNLVHHYSSPSHSSILTSFARQVSQ